MNEYDVKRLALVLAIQAEIEAMKIFNTQREIAGDSPGYNYGHFVEKAEELRNLAYAHNDQL